MVVGVLVTPQLMCTSTNIQQGLRAVATMETPHEDHKDKRFILHVAEENVKIP